MRSVAGRGAGVLVAASALVFTLLGLILIPLAGIQDDEALFAAPLFKAPFLPYTISILGHHPPLMVFPYTGALKTYVFWPLLKVFAPGPYSLRVPVLLMGALTILGVYYFARRIAGPRAAVFAALLLASDPTFLMSDTFDWGPVALQHLLLVLALCLIARGNIITASFVGGLALWEKSVFVWALAGLIAGAVAAYGPEIRAALHSGGVLDKRRIARAALAFLIGASPLIAYNIKSGSETVKSTAHFSLDHLPRKFQELGLALNGEGMFRFLVAEPWEANAKAPDTLAADVSDSIHDVSGDRRSTLFPFALILAVLAVPLWWRGPSHKPALFAIVFSLTAFALMAVTRDAGEAIHHTVLLWPMPQLLVGVVLAAIPWRWLAGALAAVLVVSNLLVINQYLFQLEQYGADGGFSDAIYRLSEQLPVSTEDKIYTMDWGLTQTLTFLHHGKLPLVAASDPFSTPEPDAAGQRAIESMLSDPHGLFIDHVREREVFSGVGERLDAAARVAGFQKQLVQTVADSTGRPVFQAFRFRR